MLKGSRVVEPWMLKEIADEVAFIPATVPLSRRAPLPKVANPVQIATLPITALVDVEMVPLPPPQVVV